MLKYKVVLAGAKNVGKSSLIARYCDNVFDENMMATIGVAFKSKKIELSDKLVLHLNIWDFAGEKKFRTLFPPYVKGASAALILYDTTRKNTLNDADNWIKLVDKNSAVDGIVKILIGTKIDLKDQCEITKNDAEKFSKDYNWGPTEIIETSAKTGENVEQAFIDVAKAIVDLKMQVCKSCGEYFSKKENVCSYCGK